jgi:asparagine synthase (glutamine-hydrolysing)
LLDHDATETMVNGILRLPPAHAMTWHSREGITLRRYWDLQLNHELDTPPAKRVSLIAEFRRRLEETISLHLRSDVPVGSCLSGGLDSSSIVCLVSRELRKRGASEGWQHTFSACFEDPHLDERRYIQAVADDTHCQTHFVFPNGKQLREEIDAWLWHQEEPVSGSSPYAQYCVARLARQHGIKVLLDGQGADEQLAGYRKFILVYLRQLLKARRYVRSVNEAIAFFLSPAILKTSGLVAGRRYLFNSVPEVDLLWPDELKPLRPAALGLGNSLDERLRADLMQFSLPTLLRYEDRNTMAFGVESRVPFVDHVFVEWLATVPVDMRLSGGWTKRVLREALVDILPKSVRTRKSKLGFLTPEREWLAGPLADWLRETLNGQHHLGDLVDVTGVKRLLMKHISGLASMPVQQILMRLAIYESWARQYLQPDRSRDRYERSL